MSILEEIYYGNIRPTDEPQSDDVKKALSEVVKMEEALGESLIDKGQKEKISELSERYSKPELFTPVPDNRLNTEKTQIKMKNGLSPKR